MTPKAHISHQMKQRTRIRIPSHRHSVSFFTELEQKLSRHENVEKVQSNPVTASVLIIHRGDFNEIATFSKSHHLFVIEKEIRPETPKSNEPWINSIAEKITNLDQALKGSTQNRWDLPTASATGIIGLSMVQMFRKQWLPPAWTLLCEAYVIFVQNKETKKKVQPAEPENARPRIKRPIGLV